MSYDENLRRQSIRLKGYDYAQSGSYFVTICVQDRECLFGAVIDGEMRLNDAGLVIECWWHTISTRFPTVATEACVVMPNHLHGIVLIGGQVGSSTRPSNATAGDHNRSPLPELVAHPSLGNIVGWFKTMTTRDYVLGVNEDSWPPFRGRLWQRNYYEHIIRGERAHDRIRDYIANNPARWPFDEENPDRIVDNTGATAPDTNR